MKIKAGQLSDVLYSLNNLLTLELPIALSYKLIRINKIIADEFKIYFDTIKSISEKYNGEIDVETGLVNLPEEFKSQGTQELHDLYQEEIELAIEPISITMMPSDLRVIPSQMNILFQTIITE